MKTSRFIITRSGLKGLSEMFEVTLYLMSTADLYIKESVELSLCHKFLLSNPYRFATQCHILNYELC